MITEKTWRACAAAAGMILLWHPSAAAAEKQDHARHSTFGHLKIGSAWIRWNIAGRPMAGYVHVRSGGKADALLGVRAPRFSRVEMHRSVERNGLMSMEKVDAIPVPAGRTVHLEPGGYHLMMFGGSAIRSGSTIWVTLNFREAGEVTIEVPVRKRGPKGGAHGQHKHGTD